MNTNKKAIVSQVAIGNIHFQGLLFPDGSFGIGVSQLAVLFPNFVSQNNYTRQVKAILGKDCSLVKIASDLNSNKVNTIDLKQLEQIIFELAIKGDKEAIALSRNLLGLSLIQLFSDAFQIKFDAEDRQTWLKQRMSGKKFRKVETKVAQKYMIEKNIPKEQHSDIYSRFSDMLNQAVIGMSSKEAKAFLKLKKGELLRDKLPKNALKEIEFVETMVARLIDEDDMHPIQAMHVALDRCKVKQFSLKRDRELSQQ